MFNTNARPTAEAEAMVYLGFERGWRSMGYATKEQAITVFMEMTMPEYLTELRRVIATDEAVEYDRIATIRLRRMDALGRLHKA